LLGLGEATLREVLDEVLAALHDVVRFASGTVMTVDPHTLLPTGAVVEGFEPSDCVPFWQSELLLPGFNKFTDLAGRRDPVATLVDATDGDLDRSPAFQQLYGPSGIIDELRVAFMTGATCWGVAVVVRTSELGTFCEDEVSLVRQLAPIVGRVLRASVQSLASSPEGGVAMLVVAADGTLADLTPDAREVLEELRTPGLDEQGLPIIIDAVVTRARSRGRASHQAARVTGSTGRWLHVSASPMAEDPARVAVVIEPARPGEIMPILLETYGLTERQVEIVLLLARGLSSKDIATETGLSAHTVRDHTKAIFEKAGVNSRGELLAQLFASHIVDGFHRATHRA
jgi:DNA-binding CsgD family transcriptional regulator